MNCWDFMKCDDATARACPAYPDKGRDCWKVTGTKCGKGKLEMATAMEKIAHCRTCDYYNSHANKF